MENYKNANKTVIRPRISTRVPSGEQTLDILLDILQHKLLSEFANNNEND